MAKANKMQRKCDSHRHGDRLHTFSSGCSKVCEDVPPKKKHLKASEKKDWKNASCSVCMDYPHNAVLLLCSSYDKGCRPYMCATSNRYSNCLEQYRKAYTKVSSTPSTEAWQGSAAVPDCMAISSSSDGKTEMSELLCPLCRGQVKGWTVVEPARKYLNAKKRSCMQDNCSFIGTYKQLRKHVKLEHPLARPREVDPSLAEKWKKLENERELNDVFSTIRSTMPGAIVIGDYVIEGNYGGFSRDYDMDGYLDDALFRLGSRNQRWSGPQFSPDFFDDFDSFDEEDFAMHRGGSVGASGRIDNYASQVARRRSGVFLGRSRRWRRHRGGT